MPVVMAANPAAKDSQGLENVSMAMLTIFI